MRASQASGRDHKEAQALRPSHGPGPTRPHGSHSSQNTPRCYKTLYDKDLGAKETIRRYNGHIPGHPKYDVKLPLSDPRNHYIQYRTVPQADLCVPSFTVDRNTLFYPKVEVALFELNDNVNNAFLQQLAVKIAFPVDLEVFYHPITKKHLAMAMVVFTTFEEAQRFVREYNGKSVMGGQIFCCHDPYFALLSQRYEDVTGENMRIPVHLKNLDEGILNMRRGQLVKGKCESRCNRTSPLTIMERNQEEDMDMESPSGSDVETQECMSKLEQRPSTSGGPTSKRKRSSTESPCTPQIEPALVIPRIAPLPSSTGFTSRVPPPGMPSLRTGFISSHQSRNDTTPLLSPTPPVFGAASSYPPPPPYTALPSDGSTVLPPNYPHLSKPSQCLDSTAVGEKATTSMPHAVNSPLGSSRGKRSSHGRQHKRKKKKRKRHSSYSSSSDSSSNSSLNIGEYLRVEKKESTKSKYISREGEGQEKTIVEEIKTITKKKYRVRDSKRSDVKPTTGLQTISSDESVGGTADYDNKKKATVPLKPSEREKKVEGHRWSSSSTESDEEQYRKVDQKSDKSLSTSSVHDVAGHASSICVTAPHQSSAVFTTCPPFPTTHPAGLMPPTSIDVSQPVSASVAALTLVPTYLPPPGFPLPHVNPSSMGAPLFNPLLPPPSFHLPHPHIHAKRELPKVALRFVEDSPSCQTTPPAPLQPTLADRVASIFGGNSFLDTNSKVGSTAVHRTASEVSAYGDLDDMDVDKVSSKSPTAEISMSCTHSEMQLETRQRRKMHKTHHKTTDKQKNRFVRKLNSVREATERAIGEEIVDVVTKDFYKRIEVVSFEILEEVLAELRHELEEQKRNEAQEALRAQAQLVTPEKPSDVAQLVSPLAAALNGSAEKLGNFPFTINMPKLPSFRRKIRPPSPESESSQSPDARYSDNESDYSDAAQKSSSSSQTTKSSVCVVNRRRSRLHCRSIYSRSKSPSENSSRYSKAPSVKSPQSVVSTQRESVSGVSAAVSTASSVASSSQSLASSDDEDHVISTATDIPALDIECRKTDAETEEKPLWERILNGSSLEWSELMPRDLYHVNLSEHCYFKLLEDEENLGKPETHLVSEDKTVAIPKKAKLSKHERELIGLLPTIEARVPPQPKILYPPWSDEDRVRHIHKWDCCFDPEDQEYLKQAWLALQPSGESVFSSPWNRPIRFNFFSWSDKPRLLSKPMKKGGLDLYYADSELDGILPNENGCARTRGFFRLSAKEKRRLIRRPEDEQYDKTVINERDEAAVRHNVVLTKESRSMHRRLLTTMGDTNTDFFKVNQLKYRKKMIKFARSRIHGWGLYAMEPIAPDDMIVEYVGQKIRNTVADVREKAYERRGIGSSYLFRIDDTTVIDATRMGNFARFINHSCQPNCYAKVVTVDGDKRIVIYSKTLINKGDEITYDYKFPIEEDKVDCLCGAPNCRGTLN